MNFLLSDDEVVALAARAGSRWATPLPTVVISDDGDLGAALVRGARSLRIRGLVRGGAGEAEPVEELGDALRGFASAPEVVVRTARAQVAVDPVGGLALATRLGDGQVLVDLVTAAGVHDLNVVDADVATALITQSLEQLFERGPISASGESAMVAHVVAGGQGMEVRRNVVMIGADNPISDWGQAGALLSSAIAEALSESPA
jgi:hypothetical protein